MNGRFVIYHIDSAGTKWYYTDCYFKPWMKGDINALEFATKKDADKKVVQMNCTTCTAYVEEAI